MAILQTFIPTSLHLFPCHQFLFSLLFGPQLKGNEAANVQKDRNLLALSSCCRPLWKRAFSSLPLHNKKRLNKACKQVLSGYMMVQFTAHLPPMLSFFSPAYFDLFPSSRMTSFGRTPLLWRFKWNALIRPQEPICLLNCFEDLKRGKVRERLRRFCMTWPVCIAVPGGLIFPR